MPSTTVESAVSVCHDAHAAGLGTEADLAGIDPGHVGRDQVPTVKPESANPARVREAIQQGLKDRYNDMRNPSAARAAAKESTVVSELPPFDLVIKGAVE
jgi:hypothetical protein